MNRIYKFDAAEIEAMSTAMVESMGFLHALLAKPNGDFVIGDESCPGSLRDGCRVAGMVGMSMRDQNVIRRDGVHPNRPGQFIARNKRVEQQRAICDFH